jgi:hypothetical protein
MELEQELEHKCEHQCEDGSGDESEDEHSCEHEHEDEGEHEQDPLINLENKLKLIITEAEKVNDDYIQGQLELTIFWDILILLIQRLKRIISVANMKKL